MEKIIDQIRSATETDLSHMLCSLIEAAASRVDVNCVCDICPVADRCSKGTPGFKALLKDSGDMNFDRFIIGL